jgi:hypothetical protein
MNNISELILQQAGVKPSYFTPMSRYFGIEIAVYESMATAPTPYVRRRFLPQMEQFQTIQEHQVSQGERPDNLTYQYMNDPEQFWKICDANGVMHPNELTESIGKTVRITLPQGIIPQ